MPSTGRAPSRRRIIAAFAAVYVVWGSTYLGIKLAAETLPPFLMAGTRFLVAGAILYLWSRRDAGEGSGGHTGERPARLTGAQWSLAFVVGVLLLFGGNGAVVWASHRIPTGSIALLIAATPIWMVVIDWFRPGGRRPGGAVAAGLVLGTAGLALLVDARGGTGGGRVDPVSAAVVLLGSLSWAVGSLASRSRRMPRAANLSTAIQMFGGGIVLVVAGLAVGEGRGFSFADVSLRSALAWVYLVTFGSLVGYTAYIWLLGKVSAAKVATYAYVNPIVAVLLGWAFAGEAVTSRMMLAAAVIVGAVALITAGSARSAAEPASGGEPTTKRVADAA
jgi:drug/metabolite transporter (DMT)-like permease